MAKLLRGGDLPELNTIDPCFRLCDLIKTCRELFWLKHKLVL